MVDLAPQQEIVDSKGSTVQYSGTVGTIATNVPTIPGNRINAMFIRCPNQSPTSKTLSYSIDNGTTFFVLSPGEAITWALKGSKTQLQIKGNIAGVLYEIMLNFDQAGEV